MSNENRATSPLIGIFDSGIGGLTVANAIVDLLPRYSLRYFADTAHVPYGGQPAETIQGYSVDISRFLLEQGCKVIVVACNTATAAALNTLRITWPQVPFIGMEPAVKPAAEATHTNKVGVLATRGTFSSERYAALMHRFAANVTVFQNPCLGLVEAIETGETESASTALLLREILEPMLVQGVDTLVLGCTHYPLVRPLIERIVGPAVTVIDPAPAIARQLYRVLEANDWIPAGQAPGHHFFYTSGNPESLQIHAHRFFKAPFQVEHRLIS